MPRPEVKEDVPVCTRAGRLPRGQKGRRPHPLIRVDMHPQVFAVGSVLAKGCPCMLGRVQESVRCQERDKEQKNKILRNKST